MNQDITYNMDAFIIMYLEPECELCYLTHFCKYEDYVFLCVFMFTFFSHGPWSKLNKAKEPPFRPVVLDLLLTLGCSYKSRVYRSLP